jgi:hydroxymethylglutaryl-CoA lyase
MPNTSCRHKVFIEDESLRDGLQMESRIFSLEEKLALYRILKKAGIPRIQVGSFVHPEIVPQMADTDSLIRAIGKETDVVLSVLILNEKGLERALSCNVPHMSMSVSLSDTHSRKNTGKPAVEALESMSRLISSALQSGIQARAGLQCVFGCVYEGAIDESVVLRAAGKLAESGAKEINLADTTGMATPYAIRSMVHALKQELPHVILSLHLHDTRGLGLANLFSGYEAGVRSFDVCAGGLGGCPFVKGAAGNVAAEDVVNLFESIGIETGINMKTLCDAVDFLEETLGRRLPGHMKRVVGNRPDTVDEAP